MGPSYPTDHPARNAVLYRAWGADYIPDVPDVRRGTTRLVLAAVAVTLVLVVAAAPGLMTGVLARRLTRDLGTSVRLGWLVWNPLSGQWTLHGIRIAAEGHGDALSARRATATIHLWDVVRGRHRVRGLTLYSPRVRLRETAHGWQLPLPSPPSDAGTSAPAWPAVVVDRASARQGSVRFQARRAAPAIVRVHRLGLAGATDARGSSAHLTGRGGLARAAVRLAGRVRTAPDRRRLRVHATAHDVDLARVFRLTGWRALPGTRGSAALNVVYDEAVHGAHTHRKASGQLRGHDLALDGERDPGLRVRALTLGHFAIDLEARRAALGELTVRGAEAWVHRDGRRITIPGVFSSDGAEEPGAGWDLTLARATVTDARLHHLDAASGEETLGLVVEQATTAALGDAVRSAPFSVTSTLTSGGHAQLSGDVTTAPLEASARLVMTDVQLAALVPLLGSPVGLESGRASGALDLVLRGGGVHASGGLVIDDLKTISPDPARPEDVLACRQLRLRFREARSEPPRVTFDRVEIDWPYVLVDRTAAGVFPLTLAAAPATRSDPDAPLHVDHLAVRDGRIDFRDARLEPPYWRSLAHLRLEATNADLLPARVARLEGAGLVDELSPLRFEGTIGARTKLIAEVERLALPPFNAYLEGVSQYTVSSGAISGRSEIVLDRSQLEATNRIVLSRLGLTGGAGQDIVERELGVPLTLALALMKDYRGEIALALPFGGDVSAPRFSLRSLALQALVQAIRGAILSPLNALGRVVLHEGRIERFDLEPIPFAAGARDLDEAGHQRVTEVARVLQSHPDLALRLRGMAAGVDVDRLREQEVLGSLARGTLRAFLDSRLAGTPPPSLDERQRARLDTLLAAVPWPGDRLQQLAVDRGAAAAAAFVLDFGVAPDRVVVDTPPAGAPTDLAGAPGAGVELRER